MEKYRTDKSKEIWERQKNILPGGCHFNFHGEKIVQNRYFVKAQNSRIWDVDGNEYLDLYAKSGTMILGHANKSLNKRIKEALDDVVSVNDTPKTEAVLNKLRTCIPSMEMMRFGLSGTEVIQNALRLARAYTGKQKIIRFLGHFHGSADNVLGNQNDCEFHPCDDLSETNSTEGRFLGAFDETLILPWNDIKTLTDVLHTNRDQIAAIIMEPIMINNGSIMPVDGYLEKVRELCDKYHILLIFDEIITGFRVGLGGAQGLLGIRPDLTIAGKAVSNGVVPVSILGGKRQILEMYASNRVVHLGTYNGYPLAMAAIDATLDQLMNEDAYKHMVKIAGEIARIMKKTASRMKIPFVLQGPPLCMSFHFKNHEVKNYQVDKREIAKKAYFYSCCNEYGILFASPSRIYLNTSINEEDLSFFEERVYQAFKAAVDILS